MSEITDRSYEVMLDTLLVAMPIFSKMTSDCLEQDLVASFIGHNMNATDGLLLHGASQSNISQPLTPIPLHSSNNPQSASLHREYPCVVVHFWRSIATCLVAVIIDRSPLLHLGDRGLK